MTIKEAVLDMIRQLPDDVTWERIFEAGIAQFGDPLEVEEFDDEYIDELNRRVNDSLAGKTKGIPHAEVMREMKERFG